jgi:tRNA-splicing ligase RtcB
MSINTLAGTENPERYKVPVRLWTPQEEVEQEAKNQLYNIANLPWAFHHVEVMPDVHYGKGATVGSVIAMKDAVSPSAVGVDIGCGMGAVKTNLRASELPDNLAALRAKIEELIPVGFNSHEKLYFSGLDFTMKMDGSVISKSASTNEAFNLSKDFKSLFKRFKDLDPQVHDLLKKAMSQVGTLGGGNHFIELCLDQDDYVWLMLHSGSRNIGKTLAEIHIERAKRLAHNQELPDRDLAVFLSKTPEMAEYLRDLKWAQEYAFVNRRAMFEIYKGIVRTFIPHVHFEAPILCHHNYVSEEVHYGEDVIVTRKGAISARSGEMGIIPGSMGTRSYIVRGRGNEESFHSASHGAGRRLSRGKAKRTFTVEDLKEQTKGIECRKDDGVLDEIPGAYKDIDKVIGYQRELVEIEAKLHQLICV